MSRSGPIIVRRTKIIVDIKLNVGCSTATSRPLGSSRIASSWRFEMPVNQCRWCYALVVVIVFAMGSSTSRAQVAGEHPLTSAQTQIRALMARLDDPGTREPSEVQAIFADT